MWLEHFSGPLSSLISICHTEVTKPSTHSSFCLVLCSFTSSHVFISHGFPWTNIHPHHSPPSRVNPSDCRVKLWSYVPGLTPCLPRRVLAIKGRATSLPWLSLSAHQPSSPLVLLFTIFHLLVPAVFLSPWRLRFFLLVPALFCLLFFLSVFRCLAQFDVWFLKSHSDENSKSWG